MAHSALAGTTRNLAVRNAMSANVSGPTSRGSTGRMKRRPRLVFFYSRQSGRSRRAEGFLAQVLQRRRNFETFDVSCSVNLNNGDIRSVDVRRR